SGMDRRAARGVRVALRRDLRDRAARPEEPCGPSLDARLPRAPLLEPRLGGARGRQRLDRAPDAGPDARGDPRMPPEALSPQLEAFGARALDFGGVRAVLERHVRTSLGRRAVRELEPLEDADARSALRRAAEMIPVARAGELPNLSGIADVVEAIERARQ